MKRSSAFTLNELLETHRPFLPKEWYQEAQVPAEVTA